MCPFKFDCDPCIWIFIALVLFLARDDTNGCCLSNDWCGLTSCSCSVCGRANCSLVECCCGCCSIGIGVVWFGFETTFSVSCVVVAESTLFRFGRYFTRVCVWIVFFFIQIICCFSRMFKRTNFELTHRHCVSQLIAKSQSLVFFLQSKSK